MRAFVSDLQRLDDRGVDYCLLRNFDFLDGGPLGKDVDVYLPDDQYSSADAALRDLGFSRRRAGHLSRTRPGYRKYYSSEGSLVRLDVKWGGQEYNLLPVVDRLRRRRRRYEGAWIPSHEDYFVELLFHAVLNKNRIRPSYREELESLAERVDRDDVLDHSAHLFGATGRKVASLALAGSLDRTPSFKWSLVLAALSRRPWLLSRFLWSLVLYYQVVHPLKGLNRRVNPFTSVPTVALYGPDGSGKTTATEGLASRLLDFGYDVDRKRLGVYGGSTRVKKRIQGVYNRVVGYDNEAVSAARERGEQRLEPRKGYLKTTVHAADLVFRVLRANCTDANVIVADRYVQDLHHYDKVGPFQHLISLFDTADTYTYVLTAPPDVIASRSEYDEASVAEMLDRLEAVEGTRIDVTQPPDDVLDAILDHLLVETNFLERA